MPGAHSNKNNIKKTMISRFHFSKKYCIIKDIIFYFNCNNGKKGILLIYELLENQEK